MQPCCTKTLMWKRCVVWHFLQFGSTVFCCQQVKLLSLKHCLSNVLTELAMAKYNFLILSKIPFSTVVLTYHSFWKIPEIKHRKEILSNRFLHGLHIMKIYHCNTRPLAKRNFSAIAWVVTNVVHLLPWKAIASCGL